MIGCLIAYFRAARCTWAGCDWRRGGAWCPDCKRPLHGWGSDL